MTTATAAQLKQAVESYRRAGREAPAEVLALWDAAWLREFTAWCERRRQMRRELDALTAWDASAASRRVIGAATERRRGGEERAPLERARRPVRAQANHPTTRRGPVYEFDAAGAPLARCGDRRCNAWAYARDLVWRKEMKRLPLPGFEALWEASAPSEREDIPHRQIAVEVALCPNCAAERDARGGWAAYTPNATLQDIMERSQPRPLPPDFWQQRFGRRKSSLPTTAGDPEVDREFFYRLVKRQG